jgi:polyribonucleotide nucleotidyltransferase
MAVAKVELEIGGRTLSIETGRVAKQAHGSVIVQFGETVVLGTVVRAKPREGIDFFPLTVDYREKLNAAGKFPGGFRKREGAPNQKEILTMRNIDRPLRPLFPAGYMDEVQIQCWVLASDGQNEPDVLAGIAASAALSISSIPFDGPVGNVRVGRIDDQFVVMPTAAQTEYSNLDMLLCGHEDGLNMIEVSASELSEQVLAEAAEFGHGYVKQITALIGQLQQQVGTVKATPKPADNEQIVALAREKLAPTMKAAKTAPGSKLERQEAVSNAIAQFLESELADPGDDATIGQHRTWQSNIKKARGVIHDLEEQITREVIRAGQRTDGRAMDAIRPITCEAGVLPRVHGSALFTRGETQALVTVTLGTPRDEQIVDGLGEEYAEKFYLHYNFPPFSVGEAKRISGPSRRDIGHGMLAQRALQPVLPNTDDFPYTVRLVSDILESNGSSSMASACGGTLAMLDAGVPIKAPVAGISIGMIKADEPGQSDVYLTDIQGEEDHFGDMDFKVTGTRNGITAIQLDLKIRGLNQEQIIASLEHAKAGRLKILDLIAAEIAAPRPELSLHAPRMLSTKISPDKIGKLIGPGGKTIRELEARTGATIVVEEDGTIYVSAVGGGKAEAALEEIDKLCSEIKVGATYAGKVCSIKDFGAFIELTPGEDGLCHISELSDGFVDKVADVVKMGEIIRVKVLSVDDQGRVKLSRRAVLEEEKENSSA